MKTPEDVSVCQQCGAEVLWRKRADDPSRVHPPLARIGSVLVLDANNRVTTDVAYIRHVCDPEQAKRWADAKAEAAEAHRDEADRRAAHRREQKDLLAAVAETREEAYRRAAKVDCPKCPALEAEECLNLNTLAGRGKSTKKHTSWPHPERVLLAEQEGY